MNTHSLIPLIATLAYVPLFLILIANRPWQRQKQTFAVFLMAIMLWSFGDFLFRSNYLVNEKIYLAKAILCICILVITSLHYYLRTYYEKRAPGFPLAYIVTALLFVVVLLFMPEGVIVGEIVVPIYGGWLYLMAAYGAVVLGWDIYHLGKKVRATSDPVIHNQLIYLIVGVSILIVFAISSFSKFGQEYPLAHVGNFLNALILTYTVLRHRLLDMRIVLRRGLTLLSMIAIGVVIYLAVYVVGHFLFNIDLESLNVLLGVGVALLVAFIIFQMRGIITNRIDKLFYRDSYVFRQELNDFALHRIKGVLNLDEFGNELLTLFCGAIRCRRAYLLLPQQNTEDFYIRFVAPSEEVRPTFIIKNDSPILQWLKKENTYLPREKLDIEQQFRGLWQEERENISQLNIQLFLPIISRGNMIGLLALGEKQNKGRYRLEDINLSEKIINDVANSLEKEYFQDQLRKREQELSLLNQLAGVISSSLNIQEVYDAFVKELKEVVQVNYTAIALIEGNEIYFAAISSEVGSAWHTGQKIPLANSATEWVSLNKRLYYETDLSNNRRFWTGAEYLKRGIHSVLYLPLMNKGDVIGILILGSKKPGAYGPEQVVLLEHLASQIAAPIENSRLFTKAEEVARVDGITQLFNRRHFDERMKEEIDRHSRYGDILSILLLDLDNFKKYNDTFGHLAGDRLLVHAAELIQSAIRSSDLAFRYGGDEFAVILPNSSTMDAFNVAERMRERVAFEMASRQIDVTVSVGVASWPGDGATLDELCYAADMALYYAKRTGQNRTSIASRTLFSLNEPSVSINVEAEVLSTIYALAATLEARDKYTYGHSRRVSRYAVATAEALNLAPEQVAVISAAALLHDIGKVGIPDHVLNKEGKLLDEEWELLKQHPRLSATIVGHVPSLAACLAAVRHHHERWDGNGYPSGLKGEAIPMEARILTVTDAFEAMISERPYRKALTFKQAIAELDKCSGTQFDPRVVQAFIPIALSTGPDDLELEMLKNRQTQR
ncbi:MAG: diguanylate cyclase [Dehalococcoidia bacterium]|jgi:diguanylate cyclase (GGDEF)-like protein